MIIIKDKDIRSLNITPATCLHWVRECFLHKKECQLPAKISVHPKGIDFFTSMPCLLPPEMGRVNIKVVSRVLGREPSLQSDSMLFDSNTGELLALVDTDYITTMRTGAVAALAVDKLKKQSASTLAILGLGNTARAFMMCYAELMADKPHKVLLLRYKDQAELFADCFRQLPNVEFEIVDSVRELFAAADVIVSCITETTELLCEDASVFRPGVTVVPVHTRGFQNCDALFDKVFCDDVDHVRGFRYFSKFRSLAELGEVLRGEKPGRESEEERIIDYNIGLGLHDAYFCSKVYDRLITQRPQQIDVSHLKSKYII